MFKKIFLETNLQIHVLSVKIIGNLAKGLSAKFRKGAKTFLMPIVQKLRDKKHQMVNACQECLKKFMFSLQYSEIVDEFIQQVKTKNPQLKINILGMFEEFSIPDDYSADLLMNDKNMYHVCKMVKQVQKCSSDGNVKVRKKSKEVYAKLEEKLKDYAFIFEAVSWIH